MKSNRHYDVVTITLNPAIDRTLSIPNFAAGRVNRVEASWDTPGGKGVNVAAALADFGDHVAVTGFLGRNNTSIFESFFAQKRIADHFLRSDGLTRVSIKVVDPVHQQTTDINFPGLAADQAAFDNLLEHVSDLLIGACGWFVLSGSLPPGVPSTAWRELIHRIKAQGGKVLLDTSGDALRQGLEAMPQVIKPNREELEALVGRRLPTRSEVLEAARLLLQVDTELVVVSMGEEGACFVTKDASLVAQPPRVPVKSTVGAGDAMAAGIVAAQLRHASLPACARLATAFCLHLLTRSDSEISSPETIAPWLERVTVDEVI